MSDFQFDAPRDDLMRMVGTFELRADTDGEGRTLVGYAAKFNEDTVIKSWEGEFVERLAPGAFKRTLKNNGDQVKVLFNHGFDPSIGDKPLGKPTRMKEDATGLYVEVPLSRTSYNDDLIELITDGALDGMSFRFTVVKETWEEPKRKGDLPLRTLNEVRLYEFGPVTFPAYAATTAGVRSRETYDRWRELPEEKRNAIFHILGTPPPGPGDDATPGEERANSNTADDSEPGEGHHSERVRTRESRVSSLVKRGIK
jgi:HK97 family phage prohead protease